MQFKRKRIKGKHYKEWYAEGRQYRISWQDQYAGVEILPCYHACVRCVETDGYESWGFAGRRGRYQTYNAAVKACKANKRLWEKFIAIEGRDKVTQIRELKAKSFIGTRYAAHTPLWEVPVWVRELVHPRLLEILEG